MPNTYAAEHPHVALGNQNEQEAVNLVLTGAALAAHSTGDEVLIYGGEGVTSPPVEPPVEPPVDPPPSGDPTETGEVQWPVALTDTDIALVSKPTTVVVGSVFLIDGEYMTVNDVSNADNPGVTRGSYGSTIATHAAGATVTIWGTAPPPDPPPAGEPTETGEVQWPVAETDTDIALVTAPTTVVIGSVFLIDAEYMVVNGISDPPDNPNVTRGSYGSAVAAHDAGVPVTIWGTVAKSAKAAKAEPVSHAEEQEDEEAEAKGKGKEAKGHTAAKSKTAKKK